MLKEAGLTLLELVISSTLILIGISALFKNTAAATHILSRSKRTYYKYYSELKKNSINCSAVIKLQNEALTACGKTDKTYHLTTSN
ncbi:MAG: hypothetical protein D6719_01060 [Candidatus Dadabacteria bacterium]|nr:MAG: hypothetical protein D6719_01060 [Candidatus Dadabacteria bacterium]